MKMMGGAGIKVHKIYILITVVILLFLVLGFSIINSFTGNPVSALIAEQKISEYAASAYAEQDLELTKAQYNFKNSAYGCLAQSKKSEDTCFYIWYDHGRINDEYEYEVANHFTTYRRLSTAFDDLVRGIIQKEFSHETTLIIGDLIGETKLLTPDAALKLDTMPLQLGLTVHMLSEVRDEHQMASLLLELNELMLSKGINIDLYSIELEEPISEEGKPGSGENLYLDNFPADRITKDKESLAAVIDKKCID